MRLFLSRGCGLLAVAVLALPVPAAAQAGTATKHSAAADIADQASAVG